MVAETKAFIWAEIVRAKIRGQIAALPTEKIEECFLLNEYIKELELFYKSVKYEKLPLLLVEDIRRRIIKEDEKTVIIDEDLCVI